jgi:hypothetical protein
LVRGTHQRAEKIYSSIHQLEGVFRKVTERNVMSREIRKVAKDWKHPRVKEFNHYLGVYDESYVPLWDESYAIAAHSWREGFVRWENYGREIYLKETGKDLDYWEVHEDPPNRDKYRPDWKESEMTHYQVYETVSEGTPTTPVFEFPEQIIDYLVKHGEFSDKRGWSRKAAEELVNRGFAPSGIMLGGQVYQPRDGFPPELED